MESRRPKRRKDKYNPYEICEKNGKDTVLKKLEEERLHNAIQKLSEIQRRRLIKYYFEEMTYEQIAQEEGCSFRRVAKSVKAAIENLKKILN